MQAPQRIQRNTSLNSEPRTSERPLSTMTRWNSSGPSTCPSSLGPVSQVLYPVSLAPTALLASMVIRTSTSWNVGVIRSMPITAIWVLGNVVHIRALPSFVTRQTDPVSATAKLHPVTPTSAFRKSCLIFSRMNNVIASGVSGPSYPRCSCKTLRI